MTEVYEIEHPGSTAHTTSRDVYLTIEDSKVDGWKARPVPANRVLDDEWIKPIIGYYKKIIEIGKNGKNELVLGQDNIVYGKDGEWVTMPLYKALVQAKKDKTPLQHVLDVFMGN